VGGIGTLAVFLREMMADLKRESVAVFRCEPMAVLRGELVAEFMRILMQPSQEHRQDYDLGRNKYV
jgi:hypothetical protein